MARRDTRTGQRGTDRGPGKSRERAGPASGAFLRSPAASFRCRGFALNAYRRSNGVPIRGTFRGPGPRRASGVGLKQPAGRALRPGSISARTVSEGRNP